MSNWINNVTPTETFSIEKYNEIQSRLYEIIGVNWYGSKKIKSHTLTSSSPIAIGGNDWRSLMFDINKVYVHQNGSSSSLIHSHDSSNLVINAALVNYIINAVNVAYTTSSTVAVNQLLQNSDNAVSSSNSEWNSQLTHSVKYTWDSDQDAFSFFALGGYVKGFLEFSRPSSSPTVDDYRWFHTLLPLAIDALENTDNQFHLTDWNSITSGLVKENVIASTSPFDTNPNPDKITIRYRKDNNKSLTVSIDLFTDPAYYSTIDGVVTSIKVPVTNTFYIYESDGDDSIGSGIRAPEFISTSIQQFSESVLVPVEKRIISIATTTNFTGLTTSTSSTRLVEIKNRGNALVSITGITQISGAGGNLVVSPLTANIAPNSTGTFTMYYQTGDFPGTYYFNNEITGNMDSGSTKFLTKLVLTPWPFGFTVEPTSFSTTSTDATPIDFQVTITPAKFQDITQSTIQFVQDLSGMTPASPLPAGYTLNLGDNKNFTVNFNPKGKVPAIYTAIVGIYCNGVTKHVTFTVDSQMPPDGNLGSWISARGYDNAVVGMSYDVIGGIRYLTVGIGSGAALSPTLSNYDGINVKSLGTGTTADPAFISGIDPTYQMVVYKQPEFSYHTDDQLRKVLIWSDSSTQTIYPELTWQTRQYYFHTSVATECYLKSSVDNRGRISINGSKIADWGSDSGSTASKIEKTFTSVAGRNTIKIEFYNASINDENEEAYHHISEQENPGNIGVIIKKSNNSGEVIWDTGMVARTDTTGYQYWQEVYRIPINSNKNQETLYLNHYCVKDVVAVSNHAEGKRWSDFFGSRVSAAGVLPALEHAGLFTIKNDGYGNLQVIANGWTGEKPIYSSFPDTDNSGGGSPQNLTLTIRNLRFCLYYATKWDANLTLTDDLRRYKNLETVGDKTKFFTGFKRNGEVTYTTVDTPDWNTNVTNL